MRVIGPERLREIEPHADGVKAIHSPETAIVDYNAVTDAYAQLFGESGGEVWTGARVTGIRSRPEGLELETERGTVSTRYLVNCAGLHADRHRSDGGRQDQRPTHPLPRRVLRSQACGQGLRAQPDLPGPRPPLPVPGSDIWEDKGRCHQERAQRYGCRVPGGLLHHRLRPKGSVDDPINAGLLEDGDALLADGPAGDLFLAEQEGLCEVDAEASAECWGWETWRSGGAGYGPRRYSQTGLWWTTSSSRKHGTRCT